MNDNQPSDINGFSTPPNYMDDAKNRLLLRSKQGGFSVPDGYFQHQRNTLLQRIHHKPKTITLKPWWYGVAASLVATLVIVGFILYQSTQTETAPLTEDDIINYVSASNLNDVPFDALVDQVSLPATAHDSDMVEGIDEEILLTDL